MSSYHFGAHKDNYDFTLQCTYIRKMFFFFRLLDWVERDERKKNERIIVFKNMFDVKDFEVCC